MSFNKPTPDELERWPHRFTPTKYEYTELSIAPGFLLDRLNAAGEEGWQAVSIGWTGTVGGQRNGWHVILMRECRGA